MMISINYFVDTICIGRKLGETGLAVINLAWPVMTLLYSLGYLFGVGGGAMYSACMANNEKNRAKDVYTHALAAVAGLGVLITASGLVFMDQLIAFLCNGSALAPGVREYLVWVFIFATAYIGDCFFTSVVRNDNAPGVSMVATSLGCTMNIVLDILFVFVLDAGLRGASLATGLACFTSSAVCLIYSITKKSNLKIRLMAFKPVQILKMAKIGLSTFVNEVGTGIVNLVFNMVILRVAGDMAVATYGIILNVNTIVLAGISGVSNAMQPLVSANDSVGKYDRVRQFLGLALKWSAGMGIVMVTALEWQAENVVHLFLEAQEAFLTASAYAVRLASPSYLFASANMVLIVFFQVTGREKQAAVLSVLRMLALPSVLVFGCALLWGISGVWMTMLAVEIIVFAACLCVFFHKRIKNRKQLKREGQ